MRQQGPVVGLATVTALLAAAAFMIGRTAHAATPNPFELRRDVPVGIDHSPGGAVAAADEYLGTEQATVERDPARFAALVSEDYASGLKVAAIAGAQQHRQRDPRGMTIWARGGESFTVIGAQRLDRYRAESAQITAWAGQVFWGPGQPPCQAWSLGRVTLAWHDDRWEVTGMTTLPSAAPAPAALPQATLADQSAAAFSAQLAGFTAVSYGSPG
jgi:hypothetical protein